MKSTTVQQKNQRSRQPSTTRKQRNKTACLTTGSSSRSHRSQIDPGFARVCDGLEELKKVILEMTSVLQRGQNELSVTLGSQVNKIINKLNVSFSEGSEASSLSTLLSPTGSSLSALVTENSAAVIEKSVSK
jgi:hypothetical protein